MKSNSQIPHQSFRRGPMAGSRKGANGKRRRTPGLSTLSRPLPSPRPLLVCLLTTLSLDLSPIRNNNNPSPPPPCSIVNSSPQSLLAAAAAAESPGAMAAAMATVAANMGAMTAFGAATPVKSRFLAGSSSVSALGCSNGSRVSMAEWLPGNPRPAYLDGSAPGDFGFDPLGLGEVPENLERFKESELIHSRWAMLAIPGVLIPEALGYGNWVSAQKWAAIPDGQATYLGQPVPWGNLPLILAVEFVAIAFVESQRNGEADPEKRKYPGGAFDPLGFSKDSSKLNELKLKEIKNGRLALVAFLGFCVQAIAYPGTGPLENLRTHLADPWHNNIAQIIIPRSVL